MGLDQYAFAVMPHEDNTDFSIRWNKDNAPENVVPWTEIACWRKHADLHGFMEQLFWDKAKDQNYTPAHSQFNVQPLRLTYDNLIALREAINEDAMPHTTGFFFGESTPDDNADTLAFIEDALEAMRQDMEIYYDSWW